MTSAVNGPRLINTVPSPLTLLITLTPVIRAASDP